MAILRLGNHFMPQFNDGDSMTEPREFSMPAFALAVEYGLETFQERFIPAFADLLMKSGMDAEKYRKVVEVIWKLKQEGLALRMEVREGNAESDNLPIYWIEGSKSGKCLR